MSFILPTECIRITYGAALSHDDRGVLSSLCEDGLYRAHAVIDIPAWVYDVELRELVDAARHDVNAPVMVLKGMGSDPHPDEDDEGRPLFETFRRKPRTLIVIVRSDQDHLEESHVDQARSALMEGLSPFHAMYRPYVRLVRTDPIETDAVEIARQWSADDEPAAYGVEDLWLALQSLQHTATANSNSNGPQLSPESLITAIWEVHAALIESGATSPFGDWYVHEGAASHPLLEMLAVLSANELDPATGVAALKRISDGVASLLERELTHLRGQSDEVSRLHRSQHNAVVHLRDGDSITPDMVRRANAGH